MGVPGLEIPIWTISVISDENFPLALEAILNDRSNAERAEVEASEQFVAAGVRLPRDTSVSLPGVTALFSAAEKAGSVGKAGELPVKFCLGGVCLTVQSPVYFESASDFAARIDHQVFRRFQFACAALLSDEALTSTIRQVAATVPEAESLDISARVGALGVRVPAGTRIRLDAPEKVFSAAEDAAGRGATGGGGFTVCWGSDTVHCVTFQPVFVLEY